ncbi:unnamed protein product [Phytomonas sp. Hart1]|nr:unnamed protein product [Phytomonas sp. Hart1]|eukprot:CCW70409.1 unnamed protein product [Phytomonas sp. isolate Hart1]
MDLMRKAKNLYRVNLGIAQQNAVGDASCLPDLVFTPVPCYALPVSTDDKAASLKSGVRRESSDDSVQSVCFFHDNIRIREIRSSQAYGPTFGRFMAMLLYRGESLVMVLDSHNRFRLHWDSIIVNSYYRYEDPKALLSHYPPSATDDASDIHSRDKNSIAYLCNASFDEMLGYPVLAGILIDSPARFHSNLRYNDPYVAVQSKNIKPSDNFRLPQPWAAAGFMFGSGLIMREVPFDPHLPHIFRGEEILYSMRLWTHGYNIYSPPCSILYHYYDRRNDPKVWDDSPMWSTLERRSRRRVHYLIRGRFPLKAGEVFNNYMEAPPRVLPSTRETEVLLDVERYGMGRVRTVEQWYNYAGVDPIHHTVDGRWCKNIYMSK